MKFVVHDYCGHPFQVQLSRSLAQRGHDVTHMYSANDPGPKGAMENGIHGSLSLKFVPVKVGEPVSQTALVARRFDDVAYGRFVGRMIADLRPDAVISGNAPTETQGAILKACKAADIGFVYWLQDIFSVAVKKLVTKQLGFIGKTVGWYYERLDRHQFRNSDHIVVITEDFAPLARSWGGDRDKVTVIENWAAIEDIPVGSKDNEWSRRQGLNGEFSFLYSGTLGRKHNPSLLVHLAEAFPPDKSVTVTVVAQGVSVPYLQEAAATKGLEGLKLLPIQPASVFSDVLASADVLTAMIEPDAGTFAVPSKVSSYLCAGRPILLAAPKDNLAARIVARANAGIVVDPADVAGFIEAARRLYENPELRAQLGANGRAYAEKTFDIRTITDKFERILMTVGNKRSNPEACSTRAAVPSSAD